MKEDASDQVGSSSNADHPAPVPFLLEGALRNRVAIAGFALGLSALCAGFGVVLLVGLVMLNLWDIPPVWSARLGWIIVCAPVLLAAGFWMLTYLKPRLDDHNWRHLCRIMRVMIFLTAAICISLVAVEALLEPAARIRPDQDGDMSGPVGLLRLLRLSELTAAAFFPAVFLSFLTLTSMFRYLARRVAGERMIDQCVILQFLWSMLALVSLVVSVLWASGLAADFGFNFPWLLFRAYPLIWGSELLFLWAVILMAAWLTGIGAVLLIRLIWRCGGTPLPQNALVDRMPDGIWPFAWTKRRALCFFAVFAGVAFLSPAYIIMETRWEASQSKKAAEAFLDDPARADNEALGRGMGMGLLPRDLGNRVLDKAARAEISGGRRSAGSTAVPYSVKYPDSFYAPNIYSRGSPGRPTSRAPLFSRGFRRLYPARRQTSFSTLREDEWSGRWGGGGDFGGRLPPFGFDGSVFSVFDRDATGEVRAGVRTEISVWAEGQRGDPTYRTVTDVFKTFSLEERDERDD